MKNTVTSMAQAIVSAHASLAINPLQDCESFRPPALIPKGPTAIKNEASTEVYQAAHMACLALDFWPDDAACIAQAWQRQTDRTGVFDPLAWPVQAQDFGLTLVAPAADVSAPTAFAPCPHQLGLYAVLPDATWVGRMARAGVPTLQLRFKSDDVQAIRHEVRAAVEAVRGTQARLFINDHWQVAVEAGAYGVHLGQEDLQTLTQSDLAHMRSAGLRLGLSSHGYAEMLRAAAVYPSYIALGAVFATTLKRMATPPQGVARLGMYAQLLRPLPTVAIGGINLDNVRQVLGCGVGSVAVVRALIAAQQPEVAVSAFLRELGA